MVRRRLVVVGLTLILVAAACGRSEEEPITTPTSGGGSTSPTTAPADLGLDQGAFGDLGVVCNPAPDGLALTDSDVGVTADSIQVSTVADPGFPGRPGLNQEMFDTAEAFVAWCNEHGGINGRTLELKLRDAMLTQFQQRVIEACDEGDFMMVGGGATFDDTGQTERLACGLPVIAGFAVSPQAALADLTEQPLPNPGNYVAAGDFQWIAEQFPDTIDKVASLTGDINTTIIVTERYKEAIAELGWKIVYDDQYAAAGEASWRPYAENMKASGARGLLWVGEPVGLGKFLAEADAIGLELDWVRTDANSYDPKLLAEAGGAADGVMYIRSAFPLVLGDAIEPDSAVAQYNELVDRYDEGGIKAYLGAQSLSGWLLFATAARDCGADVTRDCVFEKINTLSEWTGGGLHAPADQTAGLPPDCFAIITVEGGEFTYADIEPDTGVFRCSDDSLIELQGDYGTGARCPNSAYAEEPKPSNCAK